MSFETAKLIFMIIIAISMWYANIHMLINLIERYRKTMPFIFEDENSYWFLPHDSFANLPKEVKAKFYKRYGTLC